MNISAQYHSIKELTGIYRANLHSMSEDDFQRTPSTGGWSASEVYSHIFSANLASLVAMEKCILGTGIKTSQRTHWKVWLVLFLGQFPPGRIKAPEKIAAMVQKISKEEASNLMIKFLERLDEIVPRAKNAQLNCKARHPVLGLLNAPQWLRFIHIHSRHHIKQLDRLTLQG